MKRNDKRTTVSLADVVWKMAEQQMDSKGYNNNFSSYVADLIRRDRERAQELGNAAVLVVPPTAPDKTSRLNNPHTPYKTRK